MKALLLSHANALVAGGGGQQQCTREYQALLGAAGFGMEILPFETDRGMWARLRRRLAPSPYAHLIPEGYFADVAAAAVRSRADFVFCNLNDFIPTGGRLRAMLPAGTRVVLLSHGLASVDEIHAARISRARGTGAGPPGPSPSWIGRRLEAEWRGLPAFDHVFCLAAFEVEICRWLGARSVSWLPRLLDTAARVDWKPWGNRIGIVGTLDHPPNREGAELFCAALAAAGPGTLRLRVVTHSSEVARDLAARHAFVDVLGPLLEPEALDAEVASWSAFVHPIFCHAMGCSSKVATALNWGLPVLTTVSGMRGYHWSDGELPLANSPAALATAAIAALDPRRGAALAAESRKMAGSGPHLPALAAQVLRDLGVASGGPD